MRKSLFSAHAFLFGTLALLGAGCFGGPPPSPTPEAGTPAQEAPQPIVIGATLPLTGELASLGASIRNSIQLAVNEVNAAGGVGGRMLDLKVEDDKCDPALATNAVTKLIDVDRAVAIVGPVCSGATLAAAPIVEKKEVVLISPSATSPDVTTAGDFVFRVVSSDSTRIAKLAEAAYTDMKDKASFATLYENDDYNLGVRNVFRARMTDLGAKLEIDDSFSKGTADFKTMIAKVKHLPAIFIAAYPDATGQFLRQLKEQGYTGKVYAGFEDLDDKVIKENAKDGLVGVNYAGVSKASGERYDAYVGAYKAATNEDPKVYGAEGYDAVKVLVMAMQAKGTGGPDIKNGLYGIADYAGASGNITIDPNGDTPTKRFDLRTARWKDGEASFETVRGL